MRICLYRQVVGRTGAAGTGYFQNAIENHIAIIMAGHISVPNVTGDNTPSSLSKIMITDVLREKMGFDGIVITDALNMGQFHSIILRQRSRLKF